MISTGIAVTIVFTLFLLLLFLGTPIFITLLGVGGLGLFLIEGPKAFLMMNIKFFEPLWDFGWLAIPVYIWLGNIFFFSRMGEELYDAFNKWMGWLPGGLGIATTASDAIFGVINGSSMAACATIAPISYPAMRKAGYSEVVATGINASAGGLASMIPPSVNMIVYANLALVSLGQLFFAGFVPGFLLAFLFSTFLFIRGVLTPKSVPRGASFPWKERIYSLKAIGPVAVIFLGIFGGIYMGLATPSEAGAIGCIAALILSIIKRKLSFADSWESLVRTGRVSSMLFMIMAGGYVLNYFFFISGLQDSVRTMILDWHAPGFVIVLGMFFVLMLLGMILETSAMYMVTVPFFVPIVNALGVDPIAFGIMMILAGEMAQITPPVGVNLFVINAVTGVPVMRVARGSAPYVGILWVMMALIYFFPKIALWLPSQMWHP
jgi:C4-dicarboxylate transporter, DctM subunit